MISVDELKTLFKVEEDQALGAIFGRKKGAVSAWRRLGVPASIEVKARELLKKNEPASAGGGETPANTIELSPEDHEALDLLMRLRGKKKREAKAELYRLLAEQEREALKEQ